MNLVIMQHCPASCSFFPLILLGTVFWNTLKIWSFLNVIDQVSHPKMWHRIMVLFILIFMFLLIGIQYTNVSILFTRYTDWNILFNTVIYYSMLLALLNHHQCRPTKITWKLWPYNCNIILLKLNKCTLLNPVVVLYTIIYWFPFIFSIFISKVGLLVIG